MNTLDTLVKNTSIDSSDLGIKKGDSYDLVGKKLSDFILTHVNKKIDVSDISTKKDVLLDEAVNIIIDRFVNLNVADISYSDSFSQLNFGINSSSGFLIGSLFNYNIEIQGSSILFTYDTSNISGKLPESYSIASVEVSAYGNNTKSLIQRSDLESGSIIFPINRMPGYFDISISIISKNGLVRLTGVVQASVNTGNGSIILNVKDSKSEVAGAYGLDELLKSIVTNLKEITSFIDSMKSFSVSGLSCYNSGVGILAHIAANAAVCDGLVAKSLDSGKVYISKAGCEGKSLVPIQDAIDTITKTIGGITGNNSNLDPAYEGGSSSV